MTRRPYLPLTVYILSYIGVAPFRHSRIIGYLLLPETYRSLSRLSSASDTKAFTIHLCSLTIFFNPISPSRDIANIIFTHIFLLLLCDFYVLFVIVCVSRFHPTSDRNRKRLVFLIYNFIFTCRNKGLTVNRVIIRI